MKTIIEINGINYGSTGNIALNIAKELRNNGYEAYFACKNSKFGAKFPHEKQIYIGTRFERVISERLASLTGKKGYYNIFNTWSFLKKLDELKPDLIHFHLMHDTFINLDMLIKYINKHNIPVIWTFHDVYALTGQCTYFDLVHCDRWKTGCGNCPKLKEYPKTYFIDRTKDMWKRKNSLFNSIKDLTIVTPCEWMANLTKQSFLKEKEVRVIYNGINLNTFRPVESDFRKKHNLEDKKIILGVAYWWDYAKGLPSFLELAKRIPDNYRIVLVGTNDETDKILPDNIISVHKTFNVEELVEIYSTADVFVNTTMQDNFPTVNIEALACGLPIVVYNTGGCPEIVTEKTGRVVEQYDFDNLYKNIEDILENSVISREDCVSRAKEFGMPNKIKEYISLIEEKLNS